MTPEKQVDPVTGNPPVNYTKTLLADVLLYVGILFQLAAVEPNTILAVFPHPSAKVASAVTVMGILWKLAAKMQAAAAQKKGAN